MHFLYLIAQNCKRFPDGSDFQGSLSSSSEGKPCVPWSEVLSDNRSSWATFTPSEEFNYCRNLDHDQDGPGCYVKMDHFNRYAHCDVPYCGKSNSFFSIRGEVKISSL